MGTFHMRVLASDDAFFDGACCSAVVPCADGAMGILPHHSNMIAAVVPGELRFQPEGGPLRTAAVSAGLVKIEDGDVLLLVDTAERPEDIDANRARRAAAAAREELLQKKSVQEYRAAQANLARALSRLRVREHWKGTR